MQSSRSKKNRVIPGFGLSMGITLTFLSLIVIIPMASIVISASNLSMNQFLTVVTSKRVLAGYQVSFTCALIATLINSIFGVILAWVLVRYDFPCKRFIDGLIELPFALPTAVAGITLTNLYSSNGWFGSFFERFGIQIAYSRIGITIVMIFIGIPFIVRTIQPVLETLDYSYEEAATMLGASRQRIFFKVIFPELKPALLTGFGLAFARALGEYGSVVFIAGNTPFETEIVPLLILSKLQQFDYEGATAIALVMLIIAFILLFIINAIQVHANKFARC